MCHVDHLVSGYCVATPHYPAPPTILPSSPSSPYHSAHIAVLLQILHNEALVGRLHTREQSTEGGRGGSQYLRHTHTSFTQDAPNLQMPLLHTLNRDIHNSCIYQMSHKPLPLIQAHPLSYNPTHRDTPPPPSLCIQTGIFLLFLTHVIQLATGEGLAHWGLILLKQTDSLTNGFGSCLTPSRRDVHNSEWLTSEQRQGYAK